MYHPKVYIVIVNYKQWQDSLDCLAFVLKSTYTHFKVYLIDNNSENNSLVYIEDQLINVKEQKGIQYILLSKADVTRQPDPATLPQIILIQNDVNAGFAGGNNIALRLLIDQDAYFWLLNPDITIQEDTLEELVRFAIQQPLDAIIGGVVRAASGNHELLFYGGATINFMTSTITETKKIGPDPPLDYIHGACFFSHTSNLKKVGLLPEQYFLYWEESDWCYRARQLGCRFFVCPKAVCDDKISTTIGRGFMADYYYVRNGLLFISKYRGKNLAFVLFFNVIRFFKRVFTGKWKKAGGVVKGTIDFFKMRRDENK